ncbi:hypothetical protein BC835DRAFT_1311807 [Cytidiella melzeri]|nr:hypothetical protein BC835DRAFT_1311807 [Cytidiella melzeri]
MHNAGISALRPLRPDVFVVVLQCLVKGNGAQLEVLLGRVVTIYTKGDGRVANHAWTPSADSIGLPSNIGVQVINTVTLHQEAAQLLLKLQIRHGDIERAVVALCRLLRQKLRTSSVAAPVVSDFLPPAPDPNQAHDWATAINQRHLSNLSEDEDMDQEDVDDKDM